MKIGVDLGGSHIAVGLINEDGKIISKREKDFEEEDKENIENIIISTIIKYIKSIIEECNIDIKDIGKIGIAIPENVRKNEKIIISKLKIKDFKVVEKLKEEFGNNINISVANDGKCAAICEEEYGALKEYDDAIFLCLGTGVGGAVFLDKKMLFTKNASGFEIRTCCYRKRRKTMQMWKKRLL